MAIRAVIQEVIEDADQTTVIRVRYTDGDRLNVREEYRFNFPSFNLDSFKEMVRNKLASFPLVIEDARALVPLGEFDPAV